jgi:hypothetical protein
MFAAWTVAAIIQMFSGRYLKLYWRWRIFIHGVIGLIVLYLTIMGLIWARRGVDHKWKFKWLHMAYSIPVVFLLFFLVFQGMFAYYLLRIANMDWNTRYILWMSAAHRMTAWIFMILAQISVITGIHHFVEYAPKYGNPIHYTNMRLLIVADVLLWVGAKIGGEIYY